MATGQSGQVSPAVQPVLRAEWQVETPVLCIGAGGTINHAAAALLVHALNSVGLGAMLPSAHGFAGLMEAAGKSQEIRLVCVCMVGAARAAHSRFFVRRIRRAFPNAKVSMGFWCTLADPSTLTKTKTESGADFFAASLAEAVHLCGNEAYDADISLSRERPRQTTGTEDKESATATASGMALSMQ
jgi:hypothetical protein